MIQINKEKFNTIFQSYKENFIKYFPYEKYKWIAVKQFQSKWNLEAADFTEMMSSAMDETNNLLASVHYFPLGMLKRFCETDAEEVRNMFMRLYDESQNLYQRIDRFIEDSDKLFSIRKTIGENINENKHFQNLNSISTYLWLRYPEKYYIYKYSEVKGSIGCLEASIKIKSGLHKETVYDSLELFDTLTKLIKEDNEFVELYRSALTPDCYEDNSMHLATIDFVFFLNTYYPEILKEHSGPTIWIYSPGENAYKWNDCMKNGMMYLGWDEIGDFKQYRSRNDIIEKLKEVYGNDSSYPNDSLAIWSFAHFMKAGDIVFVKKGRNKLLGRGIVEGDYFYDDSLNEYTNCRKVRWTDKGEWTSNFTHPIKTLTDITPYKDYVEDLLSAIKSDVHASQSDVHKWWLNANPAIWSAGIGWEVDTDQEYTLYNDRGNKRRVFQNFLDAKAGDKVICYESTPTKQIVALAEVKYRNDKYIGFHKLSNLTSPIDYADIKANPELKDMEFLVSPNGSLFKLTDEEFDVIMDMISESNDSNLKKEAPLPYNEKDFLDEVFMSENDLHTLEYLLKNKKNIILQGAPGVGKTFSARRLAYKMMGQKDNRRICIVQFHQNYSYEDFVLGYKPVEDGFKLKEGVFYNFCLQASNDPKNTYFFIIDEINRGNLSKIFGELLMAIESGYRGTKIRLAYGEKDFSVPENLCIIGMMNTADRSLAMIDYALRRRFSFFNMKPGFDTDGFQNLCKRVGNSKFNKLVDEVKQLNIEISEDASLGAGFQIGHSYFCKNGEVNDQWLETLVRYDIIPMLEEYWFDETDKCNKWSNRLLKAIE